MAYNASTNPGPKARQGTIPTNPRDLLWHHQLKREHQHLLSLIKAQESHMLDELGSLKQQFLNTRHEQDGHSKAIVELRQNEVALVAERTYGAERERQVLERIEGLEKETGGLEKKVVGLERWVGETEERAGGVEERVRGLEELSTVSVEDIAGLKRKIDVMEKEMVRKGHIGELGERSHGHDGQIPSKTHGDGTTDEDGLRFRRLRSHQQRQSAESRTVTTSQTPSEGHPLDMVKPEDLHKWTMLSDEGRKSYSTVLTELWSMVENNTEESILCKTALSNIKAFSKCLEVELADWKAKNVPGDAQHRPEMPDTDRTQGDAGKADTWGAQVQGYGYDTMAFNNFSHQYMVNPHPVHPDSKITGVGNGRCSVDDADDLYAATPLKQHTAVGKLEAMSNAGNAYKAGVGKGTVSEGAMAAVSQEDQEVADEVYCSGEERVRKARKRRQERQAMRKG